MHLLRSPIRLESDERLTKVKVEPPDDSVIAGETVESENRTDTERVDDE